MEVVEALDGDGVWMFGYWASEWAMVESKIEKDPSMEANGSFASCCQ